MEIQPHIEQPTHNSIARASRGVIQQCQIARVFEETGEHQKAREALQERWRLVGERPVIDGLDRFASAELLFHVGYLASRIGMRQRVDGAQEFARDLLTESLDIFEDLQLPSRAAEARDFLAVCYWREGRFETADLILLDALEKLGDQDDERKAILIKDRAILAESNNQQEESLRILEEARPLFEKISNDVTLGKYQNALGIGIKFRWLKTQSEEDFDRAVQAFTAATFHFQEARLSRELAMAENNLGNLLVTVRKFSEAGEHLERALRLFRSLKEEVLAATVEESIAKYYLAQNLNAKAEAVSQNAVRALDIASEKDLLVEALITHARALSRLNRFDEALTNFTYALQVTNLIESPQSRRDVLIACMEELAVQASFSEGLGFDELQSKFEHGLLERALMLNNGGISHAASSLGIKHGSLQHLLKTRHPDLLALRKPVIERRHSIINNPAPKKKLPLAKFNLARTKLYLVDPAQTVDVAIDLPSGLPAQGNYLTIRMHTDRLFDIGIQTGSWAVVQLGPVKEGDPVAVRQMNDDLSYSVGYLFREDHTLRLESACPQCKTLYFDQSEVEIKGRIVAVCKSFNVQKARQSKQTGFRLKALALC